jgi:hypothetical protein
VGGFLTLNRHRCGHTLPIGGNVVGIAAGAGNLPENLSHRADVDGLRFYANLGRHHLPVA